MRIVILGAGITGLSLAWFLEKKFGNEIQITILESEKHVGGWIQSFKKEGFHFELGPHSCRQNNLELIELIKDLNIESEIIPANSSAKCRYLFIDDKLQAVPSDLFSCLFSPLMRAMPSAILRDLISKKGEKKEESIFDFFSRRFGKKITKRFIDPLAKGIYAGDIHKLSMQSCFPTIFELEQQYRSVILGLMKRNKKGKQEIFSFRNGMKTLTDALQKQLNAHIKTATKAESLQFHPNEIHIHTQHNVFKADYLFSTLPTWALAPLIKPHDQLLAENLRNIEYKSLTTIHLGFHTNVLKNQGFGYLIPSTENENVLGMIWDSSIFPQQNERNNETRLTIMLEDKYDENKCREISLDVLKRHLGIQQKPDLIHISKLEKAIPQYTIGHQTRIKNIELQTKQLSPRLKLLGSAFGGVSVAERIAEAKHHSMSTSSISSILSI